MCTYVRMYMHSSIFVCVYMHFFMDFLNCSNMLHSLSSVMCVCVQGLLYPCTYVRTYVCMYVCTYVRMYVRMYVCMYVCTYVHMYVHTHIRNIRTCVYIRTYSVP